MLVAVAASACGSVEDDGTPTAEATRSAAAGAETPTGPVTVTDARGAELTLDAPADEVVGLEWGVVENLVSLGVMPVGAADVEGYSAWVSAAPLAEGVADVGMRGEPSVDALIALEPDLVIATTDLAPNVVSQLEEFVPVLVVRAAASERPIDQMRDNLRLVADAVGEDLGLDGAWELDSDPDDGLAVTDVEGLTRLGDIEFVYYTNDVLDKARQRLVWSLACRRPARRLRSGWCWPARRWGWHCCPRRPSCCSSTPKAPSGCSRGAPAASSRPDSTVSRRWPL